uniref:BRICHOS domain-containing protein n=1 Tax=Pygocentrus nattereri TaxID=42514 RepID=A0A3B4DQY2_PYGNA
SLTATVFGNGLLYGTVCCWFAPQKQNIKGFSKQSSLQVVRITVPDAPASLINQSALVDKHNNIVTYYVTSQTNHTSTVLFDINHGLICYKPDDQDTCFLRQMETSDYENMHVLLNESQQQVWLVGNETQRHTEFLGVLAGSHVKASTLQEPLHTLCQQGPVYWTRKADGEASSTISVSFSEDNVRSLSRLLAGPKERLIYFCIDICFPSNVCVSVCFYYLPE